MKAQKPPMSDKDAVGVIAYGLWHIFEYELIDTPSRVAHAVISILDRAGYEIVKVTHE
jgi:hypothetical protein